MRNRSVNHLLATLALQGHAFERTRFDALAPMPEPFARDRNVCGITSDPFTRGFLLDQSSDGGGGGDKVSFDEKQQAKVNALIAEEKQKNKAALEAANAQLAELKKAQETLASELEQFKTKAAEDEQKLKDKGKSELQLAQEQIVRGADKIKALETAVAEKERAHAAALQASTDKLHNYVKKTIAMQALGAGVAEGALEDATGAFLSTAQIELTEDLKLKNITYGGNVLDKPVDAGAAFLKDRNYYAKPPAGGNGHPRSGGAGGGGSIKGAPAGQLLGEGFNEAPYGT